MVSFPDRYYEHNNKSSLKYKSFVESAIEESLYKNSIKCLDNRPLCCNLLLVIEGTKKLRLVIDLSRYVNKQIVSVLDSVSVTACQLASISGKLISMHRAVGPLSRLRTRFYV